MSNNNGYTFRVVRSDSEIEDLMKRAGAVAPMYLEEEVYAEGVFAALDWLFDETALEPLQE